MAAEHADTDDSTDDESDTLDRIEAAKEHLSDALRELSAAEEFDLWLNTQKALFELEAARKARDPEWQEIGLPGTRVNVPMHPLHNRKPPTVEDEHGTVEFPTHNRPPRVMDGLAVADPENPNTKHTVTVDHLVYADGTVSVEINGEPVEYLPGGPWEPED